MATHPCVVIYEPIIVDEAECYVSIHLVRYTSMVNIFQLKNCNWLDDDVNQDEKCRPIKLKINEPAPPPIKLRIKRDVNDKWEAASTLSNNVVGDDEAGVSSEEEEDYSDDQEAQYGEITAIDN